MEPKVNTKAPYTKVFLGPQMLFRTKRLGRLTAGPVRRRAKAGPYPMPAPNKP
jgi:hypothetical protein